MSAPTRHVGEHLHLVGYDIDITINLIGDHTADAIGTLVYEGTDAQGRVWIVIGDAAIMVGGA